MIQVSGLSKTFSGTRLAVDNVSFDVKAGEVFGLLAPIEILDFFGRLNGMEETRRKSRIQFLLTKFDMQSFAGVRTDKLSTEMMGTIPLDAHTLTPIGVTLIPLAMFAASLMFAIALFARSYKEGQSYLTPWRWW